MAKKFVSRLGIGGVISSSRDPRFVALFIGRLSVIVMDLRKRYYEVSLFTSEVLGICYEPLPIRLCESKRYQKGGKTAKCRLRLLLNLSTQNLLRSVTDHHYVISQERLPSRSSQKTCADNQFRDCSLMLW